MTNTHKRTPARGKKEVQETKNIQPEVQDLLGANEEFAKENDHLAEENAGLKKQLSEQGITIAMLTKRFDAMEQQVGQDGTARFDDSDLVRVEGQTLDDPRMLKKLEIEAFMNEMVTVEIHDVAEDDADPGFPIFVNGRPEMFFRGQQKTVKRMFVEGLARAKKTGYKNIERVDPHTGIREYVYPSKTGLRYPFSVVKDPNRMGADWLKAVLRQP